MPRLFDTPSKIDYMSLLSDRSQVPVKYTPRKPGALSGIGDILQRGVEPFLAAYGISTGHAARMAEIQAQNDAADLEFQKYLIQSQPKAQTELEQFFTLGKIAEVYKNLGIPMPRQGGATATPGYASPEQGMQQFVASATPDMSTTTPEMSLIPSKFERNVFGEMTPKEFYNPQVDITKKANEQKLDSGQAVARDSAIFDMMSGIMGDLVSIYDTVDKSGLAGDVYRAGMGDLLATGKIPKGITEKFPQEGIEATASFVARRNELMTRMQPLLSEQFGKEGSNRIMESLLALSEKELAKLSDPRSAAVGKSIATLENFYRFAKAAGDYAKKIGFTTKMVTEGKDVDIDKFIRGAMNSKSGKLSDEEKDYFGSLRESYMSNSKSDRVNVVSPDGKTGSVPSSQLKEALKAGYKRK